eukprot:jgi/Mesvir1/28339/Mv11603-RA.1
MSEATSRTSDASDSGMGDFAALPPDVLNMITERVADHGVGHALALASVSKSMHAATWPALREMLYTLDEGPRSARFPAIHRLWDQDFFKGKKIVRIVVRDKRPNDATFTVHHDERYARHAGVMTVTLHWDQVAGFLSRHPGIDVVLLEGDMYKIYNHVYMQEHAVVLALLHIRRHLARYPCDLFSVLFDRVDPNVVAPCRTTRTSDEFAETVRDLLAANGHSFCVEGPRSFLFGEGVSHGFYLSSVLSVVANAKRIRRCFTGRPDRPAGYLSTGTDTTLHFYCDAAKVFVESGVVVDPAVPIVLYSTSMRWNLHLSDLPTRSPVLVVGDISVHLSQGVVHALDDHGKTPRFQIVGAGGGETPVSPTRIVEWARHVMSVWRGTPRGW